MALLLFLRFNLLYFLIGLYIDENGPFLPVNAAPNVEIPGPLIDIIIPPPQKLLLSQINAPILLPCTVAINNITVDKQIIPEFHTWYRNGKKLTLGQRSNFQLFSNGSLQLPVTNKVSGRYRCLVNGTEMGFGAILSEESIVQYAVLKRITEQPNKVVPQGAYLILHCPVVSIPSANITWTYGNNPINKIFTRKSYLQLENGTLIIINIRESDKGKYKCIARNIYSTKAHCQFSWNITVSPQNSVYVLNKLLPPMQSEIQYVNTGVDIKLRCFGFTNTIAWYFTPVKGELPIKISNNSLEIIIKNASASKDQGFYNCSTKSDFQIFEIIVTTPPQIVQPMVSIESTLAAMATLICRAEGNPSPQIIWYKNGIKLENSYTVQYVSPVLRINSFDLNDDGLYQCFAKNIAGETMTSALLKLRRKEDLINMPRRPENVKCFPVNYKTLNVTFESSSPLLFMNIHFATNNPFKWNSTHPIELQSNSFLIITKGLPILRPFVLYMRGLVQTSTQNLNGHQERTFDTSLLTEGVQCATQGLTANGIFFPNGIFVWWTTFNFISPKYYIIQFLSNDVITPIFGDTVVGTSQQIKLYYTSYDVGRYLHKIPVLEKTSSNDFSTYLKQFKEFNNRSNRITNVRVPGNVTGILIPNVTRITVRTVVITSENENLEQDYNYLEWKTIENTTANDFAFRVAHTESRRVAFVWNPIRGISCIKACYSSLSIEAMIRDEQEKYCQDILTATNYFTVRRLKPLTPYRIDFLDCKSMEHFGSSEAHTKSDPPGPITNQKIIRRNGLKLSWDPPINSNGKIICYMILWSLNNSTYEMNVTADENSFEFPNVTENDKINITVRVMGVSGIGPPIFIDLRSVQTDVLEKERYLLISPSLGISLGVFLSVVCILCFAFLFVRQQRQFKNRSNNQHRSSANDQTYQLPTTPSIELHEMQNLIPKNSANLNTTVHMHTLPNGNGVHYQQTVADNTLQEYNDTPVTLCSSTPLVQRKKDLSEILYAENEPILNKSLEATQLSKISSSPSFFSNPKGIVNRNETQLQNGSAKTLLPPLKHSISPVSSSEPKLNAKGRLKLSDGLQCEESANSSTINNSFKLLGNNLDSADINRTSNQEYNTIDNMTGTTIVNMDDTAVSLSPISKKSWNCHRRPIIDPNG